jgi:hypothetical protein
MFETQNLLDVQLVITSAAVLRDLVDQHRDLGNWPFIPLSRRNSNGTETFSKPLSHVSG